MRKKPIGEPHLFLPGICITLKPHEHELITRPVVGNGGAQGLLLHIRTCFDGCEGALEDAVLVKCYDYAYNMGDGGFQLRFRAVIAAATRAGWIPA